MLRWGLVSVVVVFLLVCGLLESPGLLSAWVMLELLTLGGVCLFFVSDSKGVSFSSLFYYLVGAGYSSFLMMAGVLMQPWFNLFLAVSVLLKLGVFPFVGWLYRVVEGSNWSVIWFFSGPLKISFVLIAFGLGVSDDLTNLVSLVVIVSFYMGAIKFWSISRSWRHLWCHMLVGSGSGLLIIVFKGSLMGSLVVYLAFLVWSTLVLLYFSSLSRSCFMSSWDLFFFCAVLLPVRWSEWPIALLESLTSIPTPMLLLAFLVMMGNYLVNMAWSKSGCRSWSGSMWSSSSEARYGQGLITWTLVPSGVQKSSWDTDGWGSESYDGQPEPVTSGAKKTLDVGNAVRTQTGVAHIEGTNGGPKSGVNSHSGSMQRPKCLGITLGMSMWSRPSSVVYEGLTWMSRQFCRGLASGCRNSMKPQGGSCLSKLERMRLLSVENKKFVARRVFALMLQKELYLMALENLKGASGYGTPGVDGMTPDGLSSHFIDGIIRDLADKTYQPSPVRRVEIPKASGGVRVLSIPTLRDKLVQEVARMILEAIFGSTFAVSSHGFQKGKSCHTALKEVRTSFKGIKWMFKGDISGCFDNINHAKLIEILSKRVDDTRMIDLMWKFLRSGCLENFQQVPTSLSGVPQGGVMSPLLSNIYLKELDQFLMELQLSFNKGTRRRANPEYNRLLRLLAKYEKLGDVENYNETRKLFVNTHSVDPFDPNYRKLLYVRYADDFLVGLMSSHEEAVAMRQRIINFLRDVLHLEVKEDKSKGVVHADEGLKFLGVIVRVAWYGQPAYVGVVKRRGGKKVWTKVKMPKGVVQMKADLQSVIHRLWLAGYCTKRGLSQPRFQLVALSHNEIIKVYNSVLRGMMNYYSFVDNYSKLGHSVKYILSFSCAKLLAAKFKLTGIADVHAKFGSGLNSKGNVQFDSTRSWKSDRMRFMIKVRDHVMTLYTKKLANSALCKPCVICGSRDVELHHVRHVRNMMSSLPWWMRNRAVARQKQVPLCKVCHRKAHQGLNGGAGLSS